MNTPVSFELAKLLKEKGFDKITESLWHFNGSECIKMPNKNSENFGFSAPTIAEVVYWIYNKYQIWVQVSILKDDEWHYSIRRKDNNWSIEFPTKEKFYSMENAYERGIDVVLNTYKPTS